MPYAPKKPCNRPGCKELVQAGYCEAHTLPPRTWRKEYDTNRQNAGDRGYDSRWRKFRTWFLARNFRCNDCGSYSPTEVHHIKKLADYPELRLDEDNCMALCKPCHNRRTSRGE